ncbi:MAG: DUF4062 domain-containing protein [Candidatus Gastranaerophilales bacterium]|nr:DUF4062 domain-containing protein [Candidatus Gastranaerophilales bacterium]
MSNKKYQIFISSTFEDLQDERKAALEAILITNNIPIGMESFVASSKEQFEHIKSCIESCDYYILIVGARYGTQHPKLNLSYTELEFDYAKSLNKPILAFIRSDINKCRKKDTDLENISKFRTKVQQEHLCQLFNNKVELKGLVLAALTQEIERNPQIGWIRSNKAISKYTTQKDCILELIKKEKELLQYAIQHFQNYQQYGDYAGAFQRDYEFNVWIQKIIEFIKQNQLNQNYLYNFNGTIPYAKVIKEQLILLEGLLASYEYQELV